MLKYLKSNSSDVLKSVVWLYDLGENWKRGKKKKGENCPKKGLNALAIASFLGGLNSKKNCGGRGGNDRNAQYIPPIYFLTLT